MHIIHFTLFFKVIMLTLLKTLFTPKNLHLVFMKAHTSSTFYIYSKKIVHLIILKLFAVIFPLRSTGHLFVRNNILFRYLQAEGSKCYQSKVPSSNSFFPFLTNFLRIVTFFAFVKPGWTWPTSDASGPWATSLTPLLYPHVKKKQQQQQQWTNPGSFQIEEGDWTAVKFCESDKG